jgi:beta-galactosidase
MLTRHLQDRVAGNRMGRKSNGIHFRRVSPGAIWTVASGFLALSLLVAGAREDRSLNDGWSFQKGDATNAVAEKFGEVPWQKISLPHCWGWEEAQVTNKYYRGPGWYRRALDLKPETGKRYFLRFEAAATVADVFLNGQKLGEHRGGFGAFCYELTDALHADGENEVAVRVSNVKEPDIAPLAGDFCVFGGLYRPAHLLVTDDICFTPLDHASSGVFWQQTHVSKSEAVIDLTAEISNGTKNNAPRIFTAKILDANGKVVASISQPLEIPGRVTPPFHFQLKLKHPHLWNGRADPYLYRAVVELQTTNGVVTDSVEQSLGLRFYRVDPDKGFFLNGEPYRIRGVCRHQDVWDKGWALSNADHERDVKLILEIGANAVRCSHYEQSDYFYSLCDQAGLLVWAEIPQVNDITAGPAFAETSRNQLLDLIRQNENHPAIFAWSLYNEIQPTTADPHRLLEDLNILAHGEDPTRPTIAATDKDVWPAMVKIPDLIGWNKYPGWYFGTPADCGPMLDSLRHASQHGGFCVSEYGAGANPQQHELPSRQPKTTGQWHPEEWQCVVHEADWAAIKARPFVWGSFVWNMFDFVVAGRNEGGVPCRNDKGLITSDRQLKKDAFFFYQANWSDLPVLHINDRRFTERTNAVTDVKIYSNAKTVELLVNGQSLGKLNHVTDCVFVWKNVTLTPDENHIEARAEKNGGALQDECNWHLSVAGK